MSDGKLLTDDYVLDLLNQDARTSKYGSLLAQKRDRDAPKPNTRFLRNIIRNTDNHNAALLAKENEESRAKLRNLKSEESQRKVKGDESEKGVKRKREGGRPDRWASALGGLGRRTDEDREKRRSERHRHEDRGNDARERESRSHRSDDRSQRRRRPRSREDRSASPKRRAGHGMSDRHEQSTRRRPSRSPLRDASPRRRDAATRDTARHRDTSPAESDPLEDLVGPSLPTTKPRGRGARSAHASNIDLRFNDPSYDPRADVDLDPDDVVEYDDWDTALEAVRDRAKWRAQGAERLREAGFAEKDVQRFEGGGREKDGRDVKWKRRGETKEWDRGKVLDGEGGVRVKAAWTTAKDA